MEVQEPTEPAHAELDSDKEWASLGRLSAAISGITIVTFLAYASLGSAGLQGATMVAVGVGALVGVVAIAVYLKHSIRFSRAYLDAGGTFLGPFEPQNAAFQKSSERRDRLIGAVVMVLPVFVVVAAVVVVRLRS